MENILVKLVNEETLDNSLQLVTRYVSPFNAVTVMVLAALDLFEPSLSKTTSKAIGLVAGVLVILLLYRFYAARARTAVLGPQATVMSVFLRDRANIMAICLIPIAFFLFWYNAAHAGSTISNGQESNGAIADNVPGIRAMQASLLGIQNDVSGIKSDVSAIRIALTPTDARGKLKVLGYGLDDESKAKAIEACDIDALQLYVAAKEPLPLATPAMMSRGGSNIEKPLRAKNPKLPEVLEILAAQPVDFNQRYMLTFTQAQTGEIPQFNELVASLKPALRLGLSPPVVKANALAIAVWSDNQPAIDKLLALGAAADVGVDALLPETKNGLMTGQVVTKQIASAASEARRLGRAPLAAK